MKSLLDEAKKIIEMSLESDADRSKYSIKANDWLKNFEATRRTHNEKHIHKSEASCSVCGYDLICPSCGSD